MAAKTEVVLASSVCAIDFAMLKREGVDTVLFDIEGTITVWGGSVVDEEVRQCIAESGIKKRGVVTNLHRKHAERGKKVAEQIEAGSYQYPKSRKHRKPRARMIDASIKTLDSTSDSTIMVGDKLLDVLAARNAGVAKVFWVDKLAGPDHWFDRWVYRRVEPLLKRSFKP